MLSGKNDPFLAVFEVCQSLLLGSKSVDNEAKNDAEVDRLDRILAAVTEKQLHQSALSRLQSVREYRQRTMQHLSSRRSVESLTIRAIESNYFQAEAVCLRHKEVTKRRLDQQVQCAERRMRELVFEIIGEYGKSEVRIERRRMFLLNAARLKFITRVFQLRWQRFLLLICDEMNAQRLLCNENSEYIEGSLEKIKGRVLCHPIDGAEISSVTASIGNIIKKHALQISPNIKVLGIVKLYRHQQLLKGRSRLNSITGPSDVINSAPSQGGNVTHPSLGTSDIRLSLTNRAAPKLCGGSDSYLITSPAQFQSAVDRLTHWSEEEPSRRSALQKAGNGPDKTPQIRSCQLLSNHSIAWLHPPSFYPGIWGKIHNCDRQSTQHRELLNVRDKVCPESKRSRESPREDFLNDFMTKYTQQHTALVASDSIYFCLEERSLSANHAGERDDNVSTKPSREQLTLYVNDQLQVCLSNDQILSAT